MGNNHVTCLFGFVGIRIKNLLLYGMLFLSICQARGGCIVASSGCVVATVTPIDVFVAVITLKIVVTVTTEDAIAAFVAVDIIVPISPINLVVAQTALQRVLSI